MQNARLLIFGWGNPSRGDDALGPLLCDSLTAWLPTQSFAERFVVEQDFQLQVEHALDLQDKDAVLFIDAALSLPKPFAVRQISVQPSTLENLSASSHSLSPEAVLATFCKISEQVPPECYVLAVSALQFELGSALSIQAAAHYAVAWEFLQQLCSQPDQFSARLAIEAER